MVYRVLKGFGVKSVEIRLGIDMPVIAGKAKGLMDVILDNQGGGEVRHRGQNPVSILQGEVIELAVLLFVSVE